MELLFDKLLPVVFTQLSITFVALPLLLLNLLKLFECLLLSDDVLPQLDVVVLMPMLSFNVFIVAVMAALALVVAIVVDTIMKKKMIKFKKSD